MVQQMNSGRGTSGNRKARSQRVVACAAFEALEGREMFSTYTVVNTLDSGAGSLRQALIDAGNHVNSGGADVVAFNIPGNGVHTITTGMLLPEIFEAVTIDGYTQPGSKKNSVLPGYDGVQTIVINGQTSPLGTNGLNIYAGGTTVRGLAITKFAATVNGSGGDGVALVSANGGGVIKLEGNAIYGNEGDGVNVYSTAPGSVIGGALPENRNVIYSNGLNGIELKSTGNTVRMNFIGTTPTGLAAAGNGLDGVSIQSSLNSINNNLISANGAHGVNLGDHPLAGDVSGNVLTNNDIGTNVIGKAKLGNVQDGVHLVRFSQNFQSKDNSIVNNVIAGNEHGIKVGGGATDVIIDNNTIGADVSGTKPLANNTGIYLSGVHNVAISNCTISGNAASGAYIDGLCSELTFTNNMIGIGTDHTTPVGNGVDGITIYSASNVTIGGPNALDANTIAFNSGKGVTVWSGSGNSIRGNSMFGNGGPQIDLKNDGHDTNDGGDADGNIANEGQNYPVLIQAETINGQTHFAGTFNSAPNRSYHIELFLGDTPDAAGAGQGTRLMSFDIMTNANGDGGFGAAAAPAKVGYISAIATDAVTNDSSEFSAAMKITPGVGAAGGTVSGTVYEDVNANNGQGLGESGIAGVTVYVDENANGVFDAGEANALSDAQGNYIVTEPNDGSFTIRIVPPITDIMTEHAAGYPVILSGGVGNYSNVNFGLFKGATISGTTYADANGNGTKDAGELAIAGVKVTLDINADGIVDATATSAANGAYQFSHLGPALYRVRAIAPAAMLQTSQEPGDFNNTSSGMTVSGMNFGFKPQVVADVPTYLSDMNPTYACNGWGAYERDKSNGESGAHDGKAIKLDGVTFNKGLGVHAGSELKYALNGQYKHFVSKIGVDDEVGNAGSVIFQVFADGVKLFDSGKMTGSTPRKNVDVDVTGKGELRLVVLDAGDGNNNDHADWADANLTKSGIVLPPPPGAFLSDLSVQPGAVNGWGAFERDKSNGESGANDGKTLTINGKTYAKGLGVHAASSLVYNVPAGMTHFLSDYGVDDEVGSSGTVIFKVYNAATNALLFSSTKMTGNDAAKSADVSLAGVTQIKLVVDGTNDGINNDHADWAAARFA